MKRAIPIRIILSADDGYHLDFLPLASAAWQKFFPEFRISLIVVGNRSWTEYWNFCGRWVDTLHVVYGSQHHYSANLAKIGRLWIAGQFGHDVCTLHDIDFVPCQRGFYENKYRQWEPTKIMMMGKEVYTSNPHENGKVPMSAMTTESYIFQQFVNPENLSFTGLFNRFKYPINGSVGDHRELVSKPDFSDESLCLALLNRFGRDRLIEVERGYNIWTDTLDRAAWKVDRDKLFSGGYYEAHLHKVNTDWERDRCNVIAEFLGVSDFWQDGKHWTDITGQWEQIQVDEPDPCPEATAT
jgi:hypothetical protein